jgi:hypothetical protein
MSSPSGQAPSANVTCQSRRLRTPPTVEDVTERDI